MQLDSIPDTHRDISEERGLLNSNEKQKVPKLQIKSGQNGKQDEIETNFQSTDEKYLLKVMKLKSQSHFDFQEIAVH